MASATPLISLACNSVENTFHCSENSVRFGAIIKANRNTVQWSYHASLWWKIIVEGNVFLPVWANVGHLSWHHMVPLDHHYTDVIMTAMASQITSLTVVYSIVYSGADHRNNQSPASLAFVRGIHRDWWIPRTKGQLRGKSFHLVTSSWQWI